jgi:hypothetical protein
VYGLYLAALKHGRAFADIAPYRSRSFLAFTESRAETLNRKGGDVQKGLFELSQQLAPPTVALLTESEDGGVATLTLAGVGPNIGTREIRRRSPDGAEWMELRRITVKGVVRLVREPEGWKVDDERWSSEEESRFTGPLGPEP